MPQMEKNPLDVHILRLMSIDLGLRLIGQVGLLQRAWLWKGSDAQWVVRLWLMDWFSSWNCFSMFGECSMVFQSSPTELRVLKFPGGFYPCLAMKGTQKRCMVSLLLGWVVGSKPSWSCAPCLEKGWTVEGQWMVLRVRACLKVKELPLFKPQVVKSQEVAPSNLNYITWM